MADETTGVRIEEPVWLKPKMYSFLVDDSSDFSNHSAKSKYHDNSNKFVVGKMTDETTGVRIEEFVWLKPKIYSFLLDDSSE